ncbi:hypothetical protein JAAARDRAFT_30410 [Jaapia argillacea MUCL 33604]|uniref:NAD-P-binding protein n=1 Tax=Jaapia argillacea MUCL 33604 TaxID=933084 RepID=A0A067Q8M8_9AGAM|nr:hypothetical protein JAAARDRAFT_30410 [Jaapia argillacea MUCL 33604]
MGVLPSSPRFDPTRDLPDLTGHVVIVTGGNTGIGYATVRHLARLGAKVYLAARSEEKAQTAIENLLAEGLSPGNGEVLWHHLDLSDPRAAKKSAEEFLSKETRLDVLVNNAAMLPAPYAKTRDGIQDMMMVNHISPFVFTQTLLPLLKQTEEQANADVRVVNLTSDSYKVLPARLQFKTVDDLNRDFAGSLLAPGFMQYAMSKLAGVLFTRELQRRLEEEGTQITVVAVSPGGVNSDNCRQLMVDSHFGLLAKLFFTTPDVGAHNSVFAAASSRIKEDPKLYKGAYLTPVGKVVLPSKQAQSAELAAELWNTTESILEAMGL